MDFDRYRSSYGDHVNEALVFSGTEQEFYLRAKAEQIERLLTEHMDSIPKPRLLDVGCGVGLMHQMLSARYAGLVGVDVAPATLSEARRRQPSGPFACYDGRRLPFGDGEFDLTYTANVLHHVAPAAWPAFVAELARVTRAGGLVVVFEHNPLNPITRLVVSRCEFDDDAVLLGQGKLRALLAATGLVECDHRNILFFPWSGPVWSALERSLGWLPFGAQHLVAARKGDGGDAA
jgi:SAM-dependent methyltransferase